MVDYYHVLGVQRNATNEKIRKEYHNLALKFHPDKNLLDGPEQMAKINEAYSILSDPEKRATYDRSNPIPSSVQLLPSISQNFDAMCHWISGSVERYICDHGIRYGTIICGLLIGGTVAYVKYRRGQVITYPPPLPPVQNVLLPTAPIEAEISEIHPTSLWTLAALLAALRSRNVVRLAKSAASSQAKVIAKTVAQGSQAGLSSAVKTASSGTQSTFAGSSVNSALTGLATEKATAAGGFKVWRWAAGLLGKASSLRFNLRHPVLAFRSRRLLASAARTAVRAIQHSKSGLSSGATHIADATVKGASSLRSVNWLSAWTSATNRIIKVVREKKVAFKPSPNIIYVHPTPLKPFAPELAPKSRGYKRTKKVVLAASVIGSIGYVFFRKY